MSKINEIAERVKNGEPVYLFDVRSRREYNDYHIDGSINVPFDEISSVIVMITDKNAPIYIFCGSGVYSRNAAIVLEYKGYMNVNDLGAME